jgi:predicted flap endonuclease-1-like 5' DNA nuclease
MANHEVASELPRDIGKVARRVLALHGLGSFDQLPSARASDLLALHGIGPKCIRILRAELAERGQTFADERA